MYNLLNKLKDHPEKFKQLTCGELLITQFNCPLDNAKQDVWMHHNCFMYVLEGRKIWHTYQSTLEAKAGDCVFIQKGGSILEQVLETEFCVVLFFVPDAFICDTLKERMMSTDLKPDSDLPPACRLQSDLFLRTFFESMLPYFSSPQVPNQALLELKFKELIWNVALNPAHKQVLQHFCALQQGPTLAKLKQTMEHNYCYNLSLAQFAELSDRSLSAFKRDFEKAFHTTPGKWLMNKRLEQAKLLLSHSDKAVGEVAFELGFENLSHFSKSFKAKFGNSPAFLRQKETA